MSRFSVHPPVGTGEPERVKISLPPALAAWADALAVEGQTTREGVLEQAVEYAYKSTQRPAKPKKPKAAPSPEGA